MGCKEILTEQQKYFAKEIETLKKNQIELQLKNLIKDIKNEIASLGNRVDQIEKRISNVKDRNLEMTHLE